MVIGAIFIHGLWTIRKNKNPYKLKAKNEKIDPSERGFDSSGFDQDGVGKVRVVESAEITESIQENTKPVSSELDQREVPEQPAPAPEFAEDPIPKDFHTEVESVTSVDNSDMPPMSVEVEDSSIISDDIEANLNVDLNNETEVKPKVEEKPVYQEPVTHAKPQVEKPVRKRASRRSAKDTAKRNQMGFDFNDADVENDLPSMSATEEPKVKESIDPEVIVLSVVMPEGQAISGAALLPVLLTLGMKYGDMNIFHRHEDNAGNGKVTFSLANMVNPGTFDLDAMESFVTQGISLFMTLPNAANPFEVFEQMLSAAKQISQEFNAQLLDDKRSVMTKQTEQHYIGRIREFERKSRIAAL